MRDRRAEQSEQRIADELVDETAEVLHGRGQFPEQIVLQRLHDLRVELLAERREAAEVGEQDRHRPAVGIGDWARCPCFRWRVAAESRTATRPSGAPAQAGRRLSRKCRRWRRIWGRTGNPARRDNRNWRTAWVGACRTSDRKRSRSRSGNRSRSTPSAKTSHGPRRRGLVTPAITAQGFKGWTYWRRPASRSPSGVRRVRRAAVSHPPDADLRFGDRRVEGGRQRERQHFAGLRWVDDAVVPEPCR